MKTSSLIVLAFALAVSALADPPIVSNPDLTCFGCEQSSISFGYNTYAGQRGLVTTAQIEQAKENAIREYATSSQAPKDAALASARAALAQQRENGRVIGTIEIKTLSKAEADAARK